MLRGIPLGQDLLRVRLSGHSALDGQLGGQIIIIIDLFLVARIPLYEHGYYYHDLCVLLGQGPL